MCPASTAINSAGKLVNDGSKRYHRSMEVGKVYRHPGGGMIQILARHDEHGLIEVYHILTKEIHKYDLRGFILAWEGQATHLPNHPGIGRPCEDCGEFCRQQCQTLGAKITSITNKYRDVLTDILNREQADRVMAILLRDLKVKING